MSETQIGDTIERALRLHTPWSGMSVSRLLTFVEAGRARIVAVLESDARFESLLVDAQRPHLGRRWQLAKW